jgi:hypothetical protein
MKSNKSVNNNIDKLEIIMDGNEDDYFGPDEV